MSTRTVRRMGLFVLLLSLLAVSACQTSVSSTPTLALTAGPITAGTALTASAPTLAATVAPTTQPAETVPVASLETATLAPAGIVGPVYDNPVYPEDFPDPFIMRVGDVYYGYSTNSANANIQLIRSEDLADWERVGDALPALPMWAVPNQEYTWAPGVIQIRDTFVLYYTTRYQEEDRQCISRAVSDSPEGPFIDETTEPFICQLDLGGSIDPYPFQDQEGTLYLFWKNDGNCCGKEVALWSQELSEDGLSLVGQPIKLIVRDQAWERPLIENPALVEEDGKYYLFYSGNRWEGLDYAIGYAVCETITGPCEKPLNEPIFRYTGEAMGPGGAAFFTDEEGDLWMAYHAWTGPDVGYPVGERSLRIEPVEFVDGKPVIKGPTVNPQPMEG